MSALKNFLACIGAFWVSLWVSGLLLWPTEKLININAIVRDETVFSGILMGILSSTSRTIAAMLVGASIPYLISSSKSAYWATIVAVLYVIDAPVRHHWGPPAAWWDWLWQCIDLAFPAVVCIAAAFIAARSRGNRSNPGHVAEPSAAG